MVLILDTPGGAVFERVVPRHRVIGTAGVDLKSLCRRYALYAEHSSSHGKMHVTQRGSCGYNADVRFHVHRVTLTYNFYFLDTRETSLSQESFRRGDATTVL